MDKYLVVGNPIEHSKSPIIHTEFARQTEQAMSYDKCLVALDGFKEALQKFRESGIKGLNVTVPFKEEAFNAATKLSARAKFAGAVNTLTFGPEGELTGDNTDGVGLVTDITVNHQGDLEGKRILVIGAGGAVRGVLGPLIDAAPEEIVIANRTVAKAEHLAELFSEYESQNPSIPKAKISATGFDALLHQDFDWVINGTAASLSGETPPIPAQCVGPKTYCYDMMYSKEATAFNAWAEQQGAAACYDGLGMLVEQAAEAFFIWRGVRPNTRPVLDMLG